MILNFSSLKSFLLLETSVTQSGSVEGCQSSRKLWNLHPRHRFLSSLSAGLKVLAAPTWERKSFYSPNKYQIKSDEEQEASETGQYISRDEHLRFSFAFSPFLVSTTWKSRREIFSFIKKPERRMVGGWERNFMKEKRKSDREESINFAQIIAACRGSSRVSRLA